jgi:crossover junction endodeoxyribonuclease RuvC
MKIRRKMENISKKYVWAFDISLNCTGVTIFSEDAKIEKIFSVDTKDGKSHQEKLKILADRLLEYRKEYEPKEIVIEQGFSRFAASTQAIFKSMGVCQLLFNDVPQYFYQPTLVKKLIGGKGNLKKEEVRDAVLKRYPELIFGTLDESDSLALGLTHFINKGVLR